MKISRNSAAAADLSRIANPRAGLNLCHPFADMQLHANPQLLGKLLTLLG